MVLKVALDEARNAIELAEEAADDSSRKKHLQLAYRYLVQANVDEWFKRTRPTVILAVERDETTELTAASASRLRHPRTARHRTL